MALTMNSTLAFNSAVKLSHFARSSLGSNQHSIYAKPSIEKIHFLEAPLLSLRLRDVRWGRIPSASDSNKATTEPTEPGVDSKGETLPQEPEAVPKRPPLTARERLRAARVLSRYTESKPSKPEMGSRVLDALRESDKGKKRSGLPEAPGNLLDDSKRGMPKAGLTFDLPVGGDLLAIIFSFVFITTVMFTTTYVVWKLGAIHFNEY